MIEKTRTIETLEISGDMVIIRECIAMVEDGEEISHSFEQRNIGPNDDASGESDKIKAVVEAARI